MTLNKKKLLYRRQFILGPRYFKKFDHWKKKRISKNLFLSVHPDLELNYASNKNISLILLGFLLDPYNPEHLNIDILNRLIKESNTFQEIIRGTYSLGGRWIIIYKDNKSLKMFHDAAGDRQIFYSNYNSEIWCASQPHTIAEELNLQKSKGSDLIGFVKSKSFHESEHNWAGDGTLYDNVKHLMPNKYLDLKNGSCVRYWPIKKLEELPMKEAAKKGSEILKGLLKSANNRYKLMLAVTSGIDSRTLLAASIEVHKDVFYFIQKFGNLSYKSKDIKIPLKLFSKLGLKFNVIECEREIDSEFDSILKRNVSIIQCDEKKVLYYNFYKNFQDRLNVSGNVGGVGRLWLGFMVTPRTAEGFADFIWKGETFAVKNMEKWLDEVSNFPSMFGINLLNLLHWEQRLGNWCASFETDLDIAVEQLNPFNCRKLLEILLSVNIKYRQDPNCVLYKEMIRQLWPETLKVPIILVEIKQILWISVISFLKKVHLYTILKPVYDRMKNLLTCSKY